MLNKDKRFHMTQEEVMPVTIRRANVYVWGTWLSRLLVGDASCEWASWFRAHHTGYVRSTNNFNLSIWRMRHTRLLNDVREKLESAGLAVSTEKQNSFKLQGGSGAIIAGQPDIIAVASSQNMTVYDVKTGSQRDSDLAQVMIYMYALPLVRESPWEGRSVDGRIVYKDEVEKYIPASAIDDDFREGLHDLIRRVVSDAPARKVPSPAECRWCDLTDLDCAERVRSDLPIDRVGSGSEILLPRF